MAITVVDQGDGVATDDALTVQMQTGSLIPAGSTVVVTVFLHTSFLGDRTHTVTDSEGNSYTARVFAASTSETQILSFDFQLTADLPANSTLTWSASGFTIGAFRRRIAAVSLEGDRVQYHSGGGTGNSVFPAGTYSRSISGDNSAGARTGIWVAAFGATATGTSSMAWTRTSTGWTDFLGTGGTENASTKPYSTTALDHVYAGDLVLTGGGIGYWVSLALTYLTVPQLRTSTAHFRTRKRLRARVDSSGALKVDRYNDSYPPTVAATVTVESADVTGVSLRILRDNLAELVYVKAGSVYERRSKDGGRTWSVADTIATGYQDVLTAVDSRRGIKLVLLFKESESKWYGTVGRRTSGGTGWEYPTAPAVVVSSAKAGGTLTILPDRVAEFDYTTTADAQSTVRNKAYAVSSLGSFT